MDFIKYCDHNKILLAVYPLHTTHTLQPLNVVMFKPLATAYLNKVARLYTEEQGPYFNK
jgi:hypothetical protein